MSDPEFGSTPTSNETEPDATEPTDPANLQSAEDLDEDELGLDPFERGVEPPEDWSPTTKRRPTPRDEREHPTLEERLAEERPD